MSFHLNEVDASWHPFFSSHEDAINAILEKLDFNDISPSRVNIFRAFTFPLDEVQVLILGQDPYPGDGIADGLAFSSSGSAIPASLRNIFIEYCDDLSFETPRCADLTQWSKSGVLLLNRTLTTTIGSSNAHIDKGWREFTYAVAQLLSERNVVAILWGNNARELAHLFPHRVESVHPSPLSAGRGFFGSRPFSRANELLRQLGREPIDWKI